MKDTCNLLADGIVKLLRALAAVEKSTVRKWAEARGYGRCLGSSIKGESAIGWSGRKGRTALLGDMVADKGLPTWTDGQPETHRDPHGRRRWQCRTSSGKPAQSRSTPGRLRGGPDQSAS